MTVTNARHATRPPSPSGVAAACPVRPPLPNAAQPTTTIDATRQTGPERDAVSTSEKPMTPSARPGEHEALASGDESQSARFRHPSTSPHRAAGQRHEIAEARRYRHEHPAGEVVAVDEGAPGRRRVFRFPEPVDTAVRCRSLHDRDERHDRTQDEQSDRKTAGVGAFGARGAPRHHQPQCQREHQRGDGRLRPKRERPPRRRGFGCERAVRGGLDLNWQVHIVLNEAQRCRAHRAEHGLAESGISCSSTAQHSTSTPATTDGHVIAEGPEPRRKTQQAGDEGAPYEGASRPRDTPRREPARPTIPTPGLWLSRSLMLRTGELSTRAYRAGSERVAMRLVGGERVHRHRDCLAPLLFSLMADGDLLARGRGPRSSSPVLQPTRSRAPSAPDEIAVS